MKYPVGKTALCVLWSFASGLILRLAQTPFPQTVAVDSEKIQGKVDSGILAFKGIPFAAPPVGDLRRRPPQPAAQ